MRAVHAASLCEKTTLPLQKRNLKPREYNSNNKRGDWLNAQVSKFRLLLFYTFSRQLRVLIMIFIGQIRMPVIKAAL